MAVEPEALVSKSNPPSIPTILEAPCCLIELPVFVSFGIPAPVPNPVISSDALAIYST